jgi:hypothetical protein
MGFHKKCEERTRLLSRVVQLTTSTLKSFAAVLSVCKFQSSQNKFCGASRQVFVQPFNVVKLYFMPEADSILLIVRLKQQLDIKTECLLQSDSGTTVQLL